MLISLYQLEELFVCPRKGLSLIRDENNDYCCEGGEPYRSVQGVPVLIDFSSSILVEQEVFSHEGESTISRGNPSLLRNFVRGVVNLQYRKSCNNVSLFLEELKKKETLPRILVIGGATVGSGMESLYEDVDVDVIAFDVYKSSYVQFVADAHAIPLADQSIDGVVIQAVLEHVLDPHQVVCEIHRVLKQEGLVYAETPFLQHVHEGAYDFTRFTESGHRYLFKHFACVESGPLDGPASQLIWSLESFSRALSRSRIIGKGVKLLFLWLLLLDWVLPRRYWVDGATGNFFLGKKSEGKISPAEIVLHYQGDQNF